MYTNHFRSALSEGRFVYSAELVLGRDHDVTAFHSFVEEAGKADGDLKVISVTDLPGGRPALPPEFVVQEIREAGLTPITHLTAKDDNRNFLEGRLHGLAGLGEENVLALTGDAPQEGFSGRAKPVYDLDSVLMLDLIESLRPGAANPPNPEAEPFDFFPGCVVNPYKAREPDQMMQYYKLELKIAVGAQYIITQLGYDLRKLFELTQYLRREDLNEVPIIPSVYVPTATIGRMMQEGRIPGCSMPDGLLKRLKSEKKKQRLERAALLVAAVKSLGFAGAHIGGFGLKYKDFITIIESADAIGEGWRNHMDELTFPDPETFYLLPEGEDGFSDETVPYQLGQKDSAVPLAQNLCHVANRLLINEESSGAHFLQQRLGVSDKNPEDGKWRHGFWYALLGEARRFKTSHLGCVGCGDCIQDHLAYAGCSMGRCYKELRNGPCGGSRPDGTCEVDADQTCVWTLAYQYTIAGMQDPRKFAETLVPPRDWSLNRTNSMANRLAGIDNYPLRKHVDARNQEPETTGD